MGTSVIPICNLIPPTEKVFMAGLQGEAGGDVRFNSEGDAVSLINRTKKTTSNGSLSRGDGVHLIILT